MNANDIGPLVAVLIFPALFALAGLACLAEQAIEWIRDNF